MATFQEIQDAIELGWAYYSEQLEDVRLKMLDGCFACSATPLTCLSSAIIALQYDVKTQTNTDLTTGTYDLLLSLLSNFTGSFQADPSVRIPGINIIVNEGAGSIMQTAVVYPGDGQTGYTFGELIGQQALTVFRGTSTVLRVTFGSPSNEFAQFDPVSGKITVNYPFSDGESLWVEYKYEE